MNKNSNSTKTLHQITQLINTDI